MSDAVALRRWDDGGKLPDAEVPPLEHFVPYLDAALKWRSFAPCPISMELPLVTVSRRCCYLFTFGRGVGRDVHRTAATQLSMSVVGHQYSPVSFF